MVTHQRAHDLRERFDALFTDDRHLRGDLRLVRTAIRRGWLDAAPIADRADLLSRLDAATDPLDTARIDGPAARRMVAAAMAWRDIDRAAIAPARRIVRYGSADRVTGRPRERRRVSDYSNRIDANELRRRWIREGIDLRTLHAIDVRDADKPDDAGERIALSVAADARYRWRVWLVCPRCESRRAHLYPVRAGVRCRKCANFAYAGGEQ